MELLFLWIEDDGITIKDQSFNFSNHINFVFEKKDETNGVLSLTENPNYINNFFGDYLTLFHGNTETQFNGRIVNVTGIIGENGVGKTNLLNFIIDLFTDRLPLGERFVIAFKDLSTKSIRIFHTLQKFNLTVSGNIVDYTIENPIRQDWREIESLGSFWKNPKKLIADFDVIFYSPSFDLRNYPPNISNEFKTYIDVSTNALIENDVIKNGDSHPDNIDKIELHKYSNIRRQFELSLSNIADISDVNIPTTLNIIFHRNHFDPKEGQRNLTSDSEDIFKHLDRLVTEGFSKINSILHTFHRSNDDKKEKDFSFRQSIEYKKALAEKLKVEFTYSFVHNFFKNLSFNYNENIGIKLENIKGGNLFERALYFFENHKWQTEKFGIVKSGLFYSSILELIEGVDLQKHPVEDNNNLFVTNTTGGVVALSNYERYITSIPSNHRQNFLSFSWRNISSGENALMDLYSRLLFAKNERLKPKEKEAGKKKTFLYILIDEGEIGFHPKWQSEYLFNLLKFISYCFPEYLVQVIITSHSPFLASDLPKNNLIFLEKINEKCQVVSFGKNETFASNIHTLFSNQFFMKNSVIGKYSQTKLSNELQPLLDKNNLQIDVERLKKIINTIGEPVIKAKLVDILNSKLGKHV